jgi:predicted nucleotidyltransferase
VPDFAFADAEQRLLQALQERGVRFLVVGLGAALIEGAPVATLDVDLWLERIDDPRVAQAAADAGGFWVSGFGMQPPAFGGTGLERIDVVLTLHGLRSFGEEYAGAVDHEIDGLRLKVLPLQRIIVSKRATNRLKDRAVLPALEATLTAREGSEG